MGGMAPKSARYSLVLEARAFISGHALPPPWCSTENSVVHLARARARNAFGNAQVAYADATLTEVRSVSTPSWTVSRSSLRATKWTCGQNNTFCEEALPADLFLLELPAVATGVLPPPILRHCSR